MRTTWRFVVVALAIVGFFVASTVYSQHVTAQLDADAASIAGNASPAIETLSTLRGEALSAEVAVTRAIDAAPGTRGRERTAVEAALARMRSRRTDYLRLPFYPGERERWEQVDAAMQAFEEQVATTIAAVDADRIAYARDNLAERLRPATERLDQELQREVRFNAEQQHRMGVEIPRLRRHAARIAYALDGISAVLAITLIALVIVEAGRRQQLLAQFSDRLEAIAASTVRISAALPHDSDHRPVLTAIVEEAARLVDADVAALGFVGDEARPFDDFAFYGFTPAEVAAIGRPPRPVGVLGQVIADNRSLRVDDVATDPRFHGLPEGHPRLGPFLGVPIRRERRGAGNLYLARRPGRRPFDEEDQHIIELLAAQAAVSTDNARLYEELGVQRSRAQLLADASARMVGSLDYETTLEQAANAGLPDFADICVLRVTDDDGVLGRMVMAAGDPAWRLLSSDLARHDGPPPERHPAARALRERRALGYAIDADMREQLAQSEEHRRLIEQTPVRHGLSIPMVGRARLVGVLSFFRFTDRSFSDDEIAFAEELARRAALSVDNALLHEHTRRAVQARDDLLAIVSHDLRNPLTSIRMASDLLKRPAAVDSDKRSALVARIARTVDAMMRLIEDLLDASKIESGTFRIEAKAEPPAPLLADALDLLRDTAAAKSIALVCEPADDVPDVLCDRDRILQVFSNLLGNALRFTPAGGRIALQAETSAVDPRFVAV
ncbi:MAG TPA: GAF domain-containing protein, partial [Polyangia bacterium]